VQSKTKYHAEKEMVRSGSLPLGNYFSETLDSDKKLKEFIA